MISNSRMGWLLLQYISMEGVFDRSKTNQFLPTIQGFDTRSHSSKECEDKETEMSGIPSHRNLSIFEDQYQLKQCNLPTSDPKDNRKNHIFIKMSARINGVQFSPDNAKATKAYERYQNLEPSDVHKKMENRSVNKSKVFQKIVEKQAEISRLKEENRKLAEENQGLKGTHEKRKHIKSIDRLFPSMITSQQGVRTLRRDQATFSLGEKIRLEDQLSKLQQIKVNLERKIIDLECLLDEKQREVKGIMKQSQHQINLLYENLSKRLKAKEVESYMNGKQLKEQKQKTLNLTVELQKAAQENSRLTVVMKDHSRHKDQLLVNLKGLEDQIRKHKITDMRLQHVESQLKYLNQELRAIKLEKQEMFVGAQGAQAELSKVRKELSDMGMKSPNNPTIELNLVRQSLKAKQEEMKKLSEEAQRSTRLQKELIIVTKRYRDESGLLDEANRRIMELTLGTLNKIVSQKSY